MKSIVAAALAACAAAFCLTAATGASADVTNQEAIGAWTLQTTKDAMSDKVNYQLGVSSVSGEKSWFLIVCSSGSRTPAIAYTGARYLQPLDSKFGDVMIRVDQQPPERARWYKVKFQASQSDVAVVNRYVKALAAGESTLALRTWTLNDTTVDSAFNITGAKEALTRLYESCKIDPVW